MEQGETGGRSGWSGLPGWSRPRVRRGLIAGGVYAAIGLGVLPASLCFGHRVAPVLEGFIFPGMFLLSQFMDSWDIGHGGFIWLPLTNPLVYFAVGFLTGAATNRAWQTIALSMVLLLAGTGASYYRGVVVPRVRYQKDIEEAYARIHEQLAVDANDVDALHWMGVHYLTRERDLVESARYFEKVVQIESPTGCFSGKGQRSLMYLAVIYQHLGRSAEAAAYYQRFMATDPKMDTVERGYIKEYQDLLKGDGDAR